MEVLVEDSEQMTEVTGLDSEGDWLPLHRSTLPTNSSFFRHHTTLNGDETLRERSHYHTGTKDHFNVTQDLNDYKPTQAFPLNYLPVSLATIKHDLGNNIIGIQFETRLSLFRITKTTPKGKLWSVTKIQEMVVSNSDHKMGRTIVAFSLNPASHFGDLGEKKIGYALGLNEDSKVYVVTEVRAAGERLVQNKSLESADVRMLEGEAGAVRHLSFDAEAGDMLAALYEDPICIVWDVNGKELCRFRLKSPGVECLWHRSEPYKLVVVEQSGVIRMCNTLKRTTIFTINTLMEPIFSADWAPLNSQLVAIGVNKCAYLFDLSLLNSEAGGKRIETHSGPTHSVKFSSRDREEIATATMGPRPEIRTFQTSFKNSIWISKRESVQDIAWIHGESALMALAGKQLLIYSSR